MGCIRAKRLDIRYRRTLAPTWRRVNITLRWGVRSKALFTRGDIVRSITRTYFQKLTRISGRITNSVCVSMPIVGSAFLWSFQKVGAWSDRMQMQALPKFRCQETLKIFSVETARFIWYIKKRGDTDRLCLTLEVLEIPGSPLKKSFK